MDASQILERRSLRRKLGRWRIFAFLFLALLLGFAWTVWQEEDGAAPTGRAHIARVSIGGVITDDLELIERLDAIAENDAVKGLIVSLNSPGGTTYGGEVIYKAIRRVAAKKPVVTDIRTLAASAAYMIAIAGDHIVAGETSLTGSIGVIFQYGQIKPLLDKLGVSLEEIKSAPLKAEPSPFHAPPPESLAAIRGTVMDSFDWFATLVSERRKLSREETLKLADGRIFTGRQAKQAKLVDALGGEAEIRDFFEAKKVAVDLPIVEWTARKETSLFGVGAMARQLLGMVGLDWALELKSFGKLSNDKMLLDGLVSVWQFDQK
ncbi:protease-4 [Rhizobium sp. SG_E_25_P2]|jgi:protease IV|uniref:signal peptide peptidase SppA n=1 Tax=Rhizobium sp. SG_E_25_P2 TaxID=2879942 RepID=UPI0024732184|nr:signal peptide peptidase SppA [Rhizobium sp. SG_E_25_P2]MDH6264991.1 protease-4 [Rhizobium sp. SG_E_25_P2]